jgi:type IV secretory pathway VirB10-like protein
MSKLSVHFANFRKSTPRYVQWILLVAALVVVVVLFILLSTNKQEPKIIVDEDTIPVDPELLVEPDDVIDWSNMMVGESASTTVTVRANMDARIREISIDKAARGISVDDTCVNAIVSPNNSCKVSIEYNPQTPMIKTSFDVVITWFAPEADSAQDMQKAIKLVIGAKEEPKPEPIFEPEPEPEPVYEAPFYDDNDFGNDLNDFAPSFTFEEEPKPRKSAFGTACSDFAFPGYNTAGVQSGWIKPVGGAYYYYPFSDIDCTGTPVGIYNADTGYIMDASEPTKKIGSDAEHIRYVMQDRLPKLGGAKPRDKGGFARQKTREELLAANYSNGASALGLDLSDPYGQPQESKKSYRVSLKAKSNDNVFKGYGSATDNQYVVSSRPYDRSFVLRQYKPIPATIVSDIQADATMLAEGLPVRATVDRNVYSDNGRTVIIPTGTLMLGRVVGNLPGPYKAVGRMQIEWYQFIRPDGVEFNFKSNQRPFSGDSQGRRGVPGHGSTDYLQQFVMPMLTAIVPAAVNLIAPVSDAFVNQIDLDNNTVVQSGTVRSSELAKNEIITAWNSVATKLLVDMMDNTTPPFSVAAGTRITVFSPVDLLVTCGAADKEGQNRKCAIMAYDNPTRDSSSKSVEDSTNPEELYGQARSMLLDSMMQYCTDSPSGGGGKIGNQNSDWKKSGYSFETVDFYCRSFGTYNAINNAKQQAVFANQQEMGAKTNYDDQGNLKSLNLKYNEDGTIQNPFNKPSTPKAAAEQTEVLEDMCGNGGVPDVNGCCPGETLMDMGELGFNCCPDAGGDCFPPIEM